MGLLSLLLRHDSDYYINNKREYFAFTFALATLEFILQPSRVTLKVVSLIPSHLRLLLGI